MYPWLQLGPLAISTYSLCAYGAGGYVTYCEADRQKRATEHTLMVVIGALGSGLIGARLSMLVFLGPGTLVRDLSHLRYSGQAWTGAVFGARIDGVKQPGESSVKTD